MVFRAGPSPPPGGCGGVKAGEKKLLELFRALPAPERATLLDFAAFLASRAASQPGEISEPKPLPRPAEETVVRAIRRLMETYHMLDRGKLLNETAHYVTQHVIHGRPADQVIEELEKMFEGHYRELKDKDSSQ